MTRFALFTTLTLLAVFPTLTPNAGGTQALTRIPDRTDLTYKAATALTPKEISEGWIQLFDGETPFGWTAPTNPDGATPLWNVTNNALACTDTKGGGLATTTRFGDFELRAEAWVEPGAKSLLIIETPPPPGKDQESGHDGVSFFFPNDVRSTGRWQKIHLMAKGAQIIALTSKQSDFRAQGGGRSSNRAAGSHSRIMLGRMPGPGNVRYRNIVLRPLGGKNLFNGKDLTGWKPIEGHASVFSVTPQGWLNIKNGNGEIQSTTAAQNFVLQWEVFSNGNHLNSGVFTREDPGAFWGGYEDQIRNQWEGEDRSKAVDFGTGGLYFYQPARRVTASDREWFTMTLVADGRHFGSWVNGYMVADWTDPRPETQDSARGGARLKAGVIGLQGHDPTTDLYFRNVRLAELPDAKP